MMHVRIIKVSKPALEVTDLIETYLKRLKPFASIKQIICKENDLEKNLKDLKKGQDLLVLLDERGKLWSSKELSAQIQKWTEDPGKKSVTFAVGGPYGFSDEIRKRADVLWSLSPLTLQGDLAWLLMSEQLYRAYTILNGIQYHHE